MTFNEALALLQKVHNGDNGLYLDDISEQIGDYSLGMKRKGSEHIAIMQMFYGDGEFLDFKDCTFKYLAPNGYSMPYPFGCGDFLADDWVCGLVDLYGEYDKFKMQNSGWETFSEFLLNKRDELLDYDNALIKAKELFSRADSSNIVDIDICAIYKNENKSPTDIYRIVNAENFIETMNELSNKDDLFLVEITDKDGKSEYLCQ